MRYALTFERRAGNLGAVVERYLAIGVGRSLAHLDVLMKALSAILLIAGRSVVRL
jgi:hypothetical protein